MIILLRGREGLLAAWKKVAALLFLFFLTMFSVLATKLSPSAQVSLITISPGQDLYSAFGHSTIWILDPENNIDRVYNYGTFDFDQPNFYLNFVRGHLDYTLTVYTFQEQFLQAQYESRGIVQQVLDLDSIQKQKLYDFLEWNALPENAHYLYDFYLDNCSSRLRDVLKNACGEALRFDTSIATPYSFREWMNIFLWPFPWSAVGMNVGLGSPSDRKTDYWTQMYLPINLKLGISNATIHGKNLVLKENEILYPFEKREKVNNPVLSFSLGVFFISLLLVFSKERFRAIGKVFDVVLFVIVAILGVVLTLLWSATDHWVCAWNTDLLWANPIAIGLPFLYSKFRTHRNVWILSIIYLMMSFGYYTIGFLMSEKPMIILFPLILAVQLRIMYHLLIIKKIKRPIYEFRSNN